MPLGLTALSLGHITPEQLQLALKHHRQKGARIGDVLIEMGFMNQSQITGSLAAQWGYPVLSLKNRQLCQTHRIPVRLMELYSMLPMYFVAHTKKLVIGFSELVDYRILSTIEKMFGCSVVPCFITHDDFEHQLGAVRVQQTCKGEEVLFEQRANIHEIARIARSYAGQIGAVSARFGMCSDYLWSRLQGNQVSVDLLTKI